MTLPSSERPRILWADDDADVRDHGSRLLGERFDVVAVPDGQAALESARAHPPDVVLCEVLMPRLDGFGLLRALRADPQLCETPVILLSARAGEESRIEGMEAGADDYIIKPFSARELVARVQSHARSARLRREASAVLRQAKAIIDSSEDAIVSKSLDGIITSWNPGAERIFGYTASEAVGRPITILIPRDRLDEETRILERLRRGERVDHFETVRVRKDGAQLDISLTISPVRDAEGRIVGASKIARDISDRKRSEAERQRLLEAAQEDRQQADRANRLKDEFLATLSHELRSPLNAIVGWTHILRDNPSDAETRRKAVETIHRNAQAQNQLISDILDVSRIVAGKLRLDTARLDLVEVIEAALDTVAPAAQARGVRLEPVLDPNAGPVTGDPDRLQQVVWNLLSNAIKFAPSKSGRVHVRLEAVNSHVRITVEDNGPGIDPGFLPHVFERFRQADSSSTRPHHGLGLGLAIVRHLVELHGGTARAENRADRPGAVFTIELPRRTVAAVLDSERAAERHPRAEEAVWLESAPSLAGLHILVVDDEADSRELLALVLERCGGRVTSVGSSQEGLAALAASRPDVVVTDIEMPQQNGYDFIRELRSLPAERGGQVPAVALTAYAGAQDRLKALRAGFQIHVAKPVQPAELAAVIASLSKKGGG